MRKVTPKKRVEGSLVVQPEYSPSCPPAPVRADCTQSRSSLSGAVKERERIAQEQSGIGDSTSWRIQWRIWVPWIYLRFLDLSGPLEVFLFFVLWQIWRSEPWIIRIIRIIGIIELLEKRKEKERWVAGKWLFLGRGWAESTARIIRITISKSGARFAFFQLRPGLFLFLFRFVSLFGFVIFGI